MSALLSHMTQEQSPISVDMQLQSQDFEQVSHGALSERVGLHKG